MPITPGGAERRRRRRPAADGPGAGGRGAARRPSLGWHPRGATRGTSWRRSRISATATARTTPAPRRCPTRSRRRGRADGRRPGPPATGCAAAGSGRRAPEGEKTELEEAMGHVVEAFRFLSARVRDARGDGWRPRTGRSTARPGSSRPASSGAWAGPVAAHVLARTPGGDDRARGLRRG